MYQLTKQIEGSLRNSLWNIQKYPIHWLFTQPVINCRMAYSMLSKGIEEFYNFSMRKVKHSRHTVYISILTHILHHMTLMLHILRQNIPLDIANILNIIHKLSTTKKYHDQPLVYLTTRATLNYFNIGVHTSSRFTDYHPVPVLRALETSDAPDVSVGYACTAPPSHPQAAQRHGQYSSSHPEDS